MPKRRPSREKNIMSKESNMQDEPSYETKYPAEQVSHESVELQLSQWSGQA